MSMFSEEHDDEIMVGGRLMGHWTLANVRLLTADMRAIRAEQAAQKAREEEEIREGQRQRERERERERRQAKARAEADTRRRK